MKTLYILLLFICTLLFSSVQAQQGLTVYDINQTDSPYNSVFTHSKPCMFTEFNHKLYFVANDSLHGYELHVIDSAASKPVMVADIKAGTGNGVVGNLGANVKTGKMAIAKDQNNKEWLFFGGWDNNTQGMALYKYSGTGAPVIATNIGTGSNTCVFDRLITLNNEIYFHFNGASAQDMGYYKYNPASNTLVKLPLPATVGGDMVIYNNKLLLSSQEITKADLWLYDPLTNNATLIKSYPSNARITEMIVAGGELFFLSGTSIYQYDPNAPSNDPSVLDAYCDELGRKELFYNLMKEYNNKLVYPCKNNTGACVTCIYDPATKQTQKFTQGLWPASFEVHKNILYFMAGSKEGTPNDTLGIDLWEYRGSTDTPRLVANIATYDVNKYWYSSCPTYITSYADAIYFRGTKWYNNYTVGTELMKYKTQPLPNTVAGLLQVGPLLWVYPNPATNMLHIATDKAYIRGHIYNSIGQMVKVLQPNATQVDINNLPAGQYYLQITTLGRTVSKHFVIGR